MNAEQALKEIARISTTAGLSKDIIDLLEKNLSLLKNQIASLQQENATLKIENGQLRAQTTNPKQGAFQENMGVFWKRAAKGFEPNPYCKECPSHPVMFPQPPVGMRMLWQCPNHHVFPGNVQPPS